MMKLTASVASPFVRKVCLTVAIKGLSDRVQEVSDTSDPQANKDIRTKNPLFKIPTLICDDGSMLHDSHVICEYLDTLKAEPRLIPADPEGRIRVLSLAALADGLIESALLIVLEKRFRPEDKWVQSWIDRQQKKVDASLDWLETNLPPLGDVPNYGDLTVACGLGYLDLRARGSWRVKHPRLVAWLDQFAAKVPAYEKTSAVGVEGA